jgi:hypothetical protein
MFTITLSGPEDAEQDARASLAAAGFTLTDDTYELDDNSGAWLTVEGTDVDRAQASVAWLGWRLRMHEQTHGDVLVMPVVAIPTRKGGQG